MTSYPKNKFCYQFILYKKNIFSYQSQLSIPCRRGYIFLNFWPLHASYKGYNSNNNSIWTSVRHFSSSGLVIPHYRNLNMVAAPQCTTIPVLFFLFYVIVGCIWFLTIHAAIFNSPTIRQGVDVVISIILCAKKHNTLL